MSNSSETRLPVSKEVRRLIAAQKRGGETYDSVLRKMIAQYDPEKATELPEGKD